VGSLRAVSNTGVLVQHILQQVTMEIIPRWHNLPSTSFMAEMLC